MYYSRSIRGFILPEIHGALPSDAVEISDTVYNNLLDLQSDGKIIASDANGYPIAIDEILSSTEQQELIITEAIRYLRDTDWYIIRQIETGKAVPSDIQQKRTEARNNLQ